MAAAKASTPLLAAIETGGTKIICAVGNAESMLERITLETRDPASFLAEVEPFLAGTAARHGPVAAIGIASFGPVVVDPGSARYGTIANTPKPGWRGFDLLGAMKALTGTPGVIETDVNAAALAEATIGAAAGCDPVAYVTIGTGIGVGIFANGRPVHGSGHPEGGHIRVLRHRLHGAFPGICPFHGDCLEGLASGPALAAAWHADSADLPDDHPSWEVEADYLGQLCASLILSLAPQRIVLSGGVMQNAVLIDRIRTRTAHWLGGYPEWIDDAALKTLIAPSGCALSSGLAGAFLLAGRMISAGK